MLCIWYAVKVDLYACQQKIKLYSSMHLDFLLLFLNVAIGNTSCSIFNSDIASITTAFLRVSPVSYNLAFTQPGL